MTFSSRPIGSNPAGFCHMVLISFNCSPWKTHEKCWSGSHFMTCSQMIQTTVTISYHHQSDSTPLLDQSAIKKKNNKKIHYGFVHTTNQSTKAELLSVLVWSIALSVSLCWLRKLDSESTSRPCRWTTTWPSCLHFCFSKCTSNSWQLGKGLVLHQRDNYLSISNQHDKLKARTDRALTCFENTRKHISFTHVDPDQSEQ